MTDTKALLELVRRRLAGELDALVRMAARSAYHNEGSRHTARLMRDAAIQAFDAALRAIAQEQSK